MVATRSRAVKATEDTAPATTNTLNAPPKRAGKRKATEVVPAEPEPKEVKKAKTEPKAKPTKKPAVKAAPKAASKAAEKAAASKPAPTKLTAKTTRRTTKAPETIEETEAATKKPIVEEPKPAKRAVRGRKAAAADPPVVELEAELEESLNEIDEMLAVEQPIKRATRARKAPVEPAKSTKPAAAKPIKKPIATVAPQRATRGRKATVSIAPPATSAIIASPLKAPARKPVRKAKTIAKTDTVIDQDILKELPATLSKKPADTAALTLPKDLPAKLASSPKTPAASEETLQAVLNQEALGELPIEYPKTPAHIVEVYGNQRAFNELPNYPKTPAHIAEAYGNQKTLNELPSYPKTPAHIVSAYKNQTAFKELPEYPKTPAHVVEAHGNRTALDELPGYPNTPAHIASAYRNQNAFNELPVDYPKTPAHIAEAHDNQNAFDELPAGYPKTPSHVTEAFNNQQAFEQLAQYPKTPSHIAEAFGNQQAFQQLAEYPQTPAHIVAPVSTREALRELPIDYPATPAHIMTIKQGLDELPSYPNTPAPKEVETPPKGAGSMTKLSSDIGSNEDFESALEVNDFDLMQIDGDEYIVSSNAHKENITFTNIVNLAPLHPPVLAAPTSPTKSAMRSPFKNVAKTPKKTVTWDEDDDCESDCFGYTGLLRGTRFLVDVTSKGEDQGFLFISLLEDMGAQVFREWTDNTSLTHVLFKEGSKITLEKVAASNGSVKCVNTGWLVDVEKEKKRLDETQYLVDLATATVCTPVHRAPRQRRDFFTPAKTPSRFVNVLESGSATSIPSVPSTPTSSDFDRSIASIEDKENSIENSIFFQKGAMSVPAKKSWLLAKSPMKTPSKQSFLGQTPLKVSSIMKKTPSTPGQSFIQSPIKFFSTTKKRSAVQSFGGGLASTPAKKLRFTPYPLFFVHTEP
ncbi:hypothetical protein N0V90_013125 [Kalmusia sp. IMI 367209]|nr:hypothetical protein N0V90_013125 [Kalmusia sp. IMI 367209]